MMMWRRRRHRRCHCHAGVLPGRNDDHVRPVSSAMTDDHVTRRLNVLMPAQPTTDEGQRRAVEGETGRRLAGQRGKP